MLGSSEVPASNHKVTSYTPPGAVRQSHAPVLSSTKQSRSTGTKACKGRTAASRAIGMAPQQNSRCSAFLLPPHHKSSVSVFINFFFWVSHASSWLCVCLFWGRTRQQPSQGFKYCRYMPQVGRIWLAGWRGSCLGGGEARGNTDRREKQDGCLWAPRGYYTSSSSL